MLAFSANVTAGNTLLAFTSDDSGGPQAITDNLNGSWSDVTFDQLVSAPTIGANILAHVNTLGGACTVTFSVGPTLTFLVLMMIEVSGILTSSSQTGDNSITNQSTGGAHPSVTVSPTQSGDFVFGGMYLDNSSGSAGIGFTPISNLGGKFVTQWRTGGNTGSEVATFNNSVPATGNWMVQSVCYKSASPSGGAIGTHPALLTTGIGR